MADRQLSFAAVRIGGNPGAASPVVQGVPQIVQHGDLHECLVGMLGVGLSAATVTTIAVGSSRKYGCCRRRQREKPPVVKRRHHRSRSVPNLFVHLRETADTRPPSKEAPPATRQPSKEQLPESPSVGQLQFRSNKRHQSCSFAALPLLQENEDESSAFCEVSESKEDRSNRVVASSILRHALAPAVQTSRAAFVAPLLPSCERLGQHSVRHRRRHKSRTPSKQGSRLYQSSRNYVLQTRLWQSTSETVPMLVNEAGLTQEGLRHVFRVVDYDCDGVITRSQLLCALRLIGDQESFNMGWFGNDVERLASSVRVNASDCRSDCVDEDTFVHSVLDMREAMDSMEGLSLKQLQDVLLYAFEEFDINHDRLLSVEEFRTALAKMNLRLTPAASKQLHAFLDADGDGYIDPKVDVSEWGNASELEKWVGAFNVAMQAQYKRKQLDKAVLLNDVFSEAVKGCNCPLEAACRAFTALSAHADRLIDVGEVALDAAGVLFALGGVYRELVGVDSWTELDVKSLVPFLLFLGVMGMQMAQEVSGSHVQNLSVEDASLYVRFFQGSGFSVAEFRRMKDWCQPQRKVLPAGVVLDDVCADKLTMITNGYCEVRNLVNQALGPIAHIGHRSVVGATRFLTGQSAWERGELATATEVHCVQWDFGALRKFVNRGESISLRMTALLTDSMVHTGKVVADVRERIACADPFDLGIPSGAPREPLPLMTAGSREDVAASEMEFLRLTSTGSREEASLLERGTSNGTNGKKTLFSQSSLNSDCPMLEVATLQSDFADADTDGDGLVSLDELQGLIELLDKRHGFDFRPTPEAAEQVAMLLTGSRTGPVDSQSFVNGMQELAATLVGPGKLSVAQLREILSHAFQRFDMDGDGKISLTELTAAVESLGLQLSPSAVRMLLIFIDSDGDGYIDASEDLTALQGSSAFGRLASAFEVAMKEQYEHKNLDKFTEIWEPDRVGTPFEKMQQSLKLLVDSASEVGDLFDLGLDAAAFATSLGLLVSEISGMESWENLDVMDLAPFLTFMGLSGVYMSRELSKYEVRDLTEDEALLYAQAFRRHGFSVAQFRELLRQGGATWEAVHHDRIMDTAAERRLTFVARGRCRAYDASMSSGSPKTKSVVNIDCGGSFGERAFLAGWANDSNDEEAPWESECELIFVDKGSLLVSWDAAQLQQYLQLCPTRTAQRLRAMLSTTAAAKLLAMKGAVSIAASKAHRNGIEFRHRHRNSL